MNKVTPFLWFDSDAEQAAEYYLSIFRNSRKLNEWRMTKAGPGREGALLTIVLEIEGQQMTFLNGGPGHPHTDSFSFSVRCESQEEIDGYWSKLTDGGGEVACGWLKDRFGVSWQIVPANLSRLLRSPGAMKAMMGMKKLVIADLEKAGAEA